MNTLKGKTREFALFDFIKKDIQTNYTLDTGLLNRFLLFNKNIAYEKFLSEKRIFQYDISKSDLVKKSILINHTGEKISFQEILNQQKGKLILIDIWATWCKPCMANRPYMNKLVEELSGKQKISFIYLSVDENISKWNEVEKNDINKSNSYLIEQGTGSDLVKEFEISGITGLPRYILINKKGEIISINVPRPSDPKLKELIEKYLKE
jgi:thiol-disulfide isomerase/thioredoxin